MKTTEHKSIRESLHNFFFAEEVPYGAALVRMFVPLAASIPMWMRLPRVRELFTTEGTPTQIFELFGEGPVLPVFSPEVAIPLYAIMLFCLACSVVGFKTRWSLAIGATLYAYFNPLDAISTFTKYSVIASHMLFLLAFSNAGEVWSVDAWLRRRKQHAHIVPRSFAVWPVRLMQILFAYIYFGAGITKIQTQAFFSGEQMRYWMLSNWNYHNPVGEWMAMWSPILLFSAYITVIWELMFAVLVWRPRLRLWVLGIGAAFHLGTFVLLGLRIFPLLCISCYFAFFCERDLVVLRSWIKRFSVSSLFKVPATAFDRTLAAIPRWLPAPVTWGCLLSLFAVTAVEAELYLDIYHETDGATPMTLSVLDPTVAQEMLTSDGQKIREKDKYFSFDLGTVTIGRQLANRRSEFEFGETIIAQCFVNPPHEDMWVECIVEDSEGHLVEQFGQFVPREMLRSDFYYTLGNRLLPGEYSMVLKSANEEIYRRGFTLKGETCQSTHLQDTMMTN